MPPFTGLFRLPNYRTSGDPGGMPQPSLALLLPPSEGKAPGGGAPAWDPASGVFGSRLGDLRHQVSATLAALDGGDQTLLGVGGKHLDRAREANRTLVGSPTLPAQQRYTGVVWDHLDPATLPTKVRNRIGEHVAVISGLHGIVSWTDPIPDYRLKMGARLATLGMLATWWRPAVTQAIQHWASGRVLVDLLPQEHRKAWSPEPAAFAAVIRVDLVEHDTTTGAARVVGHDAKAAKGLLARHLLVSGGDPREVLSTWTHPRFSVRFDPTGL